jgi:glycosyltransferase involved in cell wall biosynthesis
MPEKATILQVVEANAGGVRCVVEELVKALTGAGYDVTVAYSPLRGPESAEAARAYAAYGARVVAVPMRRSPHPRSDLSCLLSLRRLMKGGRYDIVHCHSSKAGVLGRIAARLAGVRNVVYSPHAFAFQGARTPFTCWLMTQAERLMVPLTTALVAVTQHEMRQSLVLGMPRGSVTVIPNGAVVRPFEKKPPEKILRIGAVGRLSRQKGFDILIKAMREVQARHGESSLVILGDGPDRERLVGLAGRLEVSVEFPGEVRPLDKWFNSIDLFVNSARWEGMPLALLEAVSRGVPVVATAVGGIPELIEDGRTGYLADSGDPHSLASKIEEALARPREAWERARRAHEILERKYDIDDVTDRYLAFYDRMLSSTEREKPPLGARPMMIADRFPTWSETFVLGEIEGLRSVGLDAQVFALQRGSSRPSRDLPVEYSTGPFEDSVRIGLPRAVELARHYRLLLQVFRSDPRWLLFGLGRTSTVILAARLARGLGCSSIHAHFLGAPTVIGACAAAVAGLPFSVSPHASLTAFSERTTSRILERAAFTASCWRGAARFFSRLGPRVHHVPHGIKPTPTRPGREPSSVLRILSMSRLVEKKGLDVLLESVEILDRSTSDWNLVVLGDGPMREDLERKAAHIDASGRISFKGWVTHKETADYLRRADVLVVPSVGIAGETEGIPNVILEAFAADVPVVASATGGIPEVVRHNQTGVLVPQGDPRALAEALLKIARGEVDLPALAASARKLVESDFSREASLKILADLHRQAARTSTAE